MENLVNTFVGLIGACIGSFVTVYFAQREWREQRKADAYAAFFNRFFMCAGDLDALSREDIIALRCLVITISLYTDEKTATYFFEAVEHLRHKSIKTTAFEALFEKLFTVAHDDLRSARPLQGLRSRLKK